jgi:DNA phosphorothioation-associated DGQHR protein 1
MSDFVTVPAIKISQPMGDFYITKLTAEFLLGVTFSDPLVTSSEISEANPYGLKGKQRKETENRLREIGRYIDTVETAFPNAIILGANYTDSYTHIGAYSDEESRWSVQDIGENGSCELVIPTGKKTAAIIDGQHRLHGFKYCDNADRKNMELLCAVYIDLPNPYQASLFATINFNQRKVDRGLAYELWGYDLDLENASAWSPQKLAVFLCRKLNTEEDSPLKGKIIITAQDDYVLNQRLSGNGEWAVSTATIVDGILSLISSNPKRDSDVMCKVSADEGRSRKMLEPDRTPLRSLYMDSNDLAIYTIIKNFFCVTDEVYWARVQQEGVISYIVKTIGIQALFGALKAILSKHFEEDKDVSTSYFRRFLFPSSNVDFNDNFFQASGIGKTRIRSIILAGAEIWPIIDLKKEDQREYARLLDSAPPKPS